MDHPHFEKTPQLSRLESTVHLDRGARLISAKNEKVVIQSSDGTRRELTDLLSSYASVNFGHCNPEIRPFDDYSSDLVSYFAPAEAEQYATWLCKSISRENAKVLYQIGGTAAVSAAISLAQKNRPGKVLSIQGGFHGLAVDALPASDISKKSIIQNTDLGGALSANYQILEKGGQVGDWDGVSCLLFEPVQGASGMLPLEPAWIKSLCADAQRHGVIVISDEIQCGYYRCGHLCYSAHLDIQADIILFGKSLTNGLFPLSALLYDARLEKPFSSTDGCFSHTYQHSALGYLAACSVSRYIDSTDIASKIAAINRLLADFADRLSEANLATDAYILGPAASMRYKPGDAGRIAKACFDSGIMIALGGWSNDRFRLMPPLTIDPSALKDALDMLFDITLSDAKNFAR